MAKKDPLTLSMLFRILIGRINSLTPAWISRPLSNTYYRLYEFFHRGALAAQKVALEQLLAQRKPGQPLIVFAPSLTWDTQLFQRPQQLALALAQEGVMVLYLVMRPDLKKLPFEELAPNLYLGNVLVRSLAELPQPYVYVLTWNTGYLATFDRPQVIYDFVDDINVFFGNTREFRKTHNRLVESAALVLVTAEKLYNQVAPLRSDTILCPNAVDYAHFAAPSRKSAVPADMAPILANGRPVVGYYGALARWFDYNLVHRLAGLRPDLSFVLIGPNYDGTLDEETFLNLPNLHWLGVKPYQELPSYLDFFDVATIPFVVNEITHSTSPLKLFEYMAGGKPVVITPMHESMQYEGVLVGGGVEEFSTRIDEALALKRDPVYLEKIDAVARRNTWQARARQILNAIQNSSP